MKKSIGELWDNPTDREAIDILTEHEANASRFFKAIAGEQIEAGRIVEIDVSAPRVNGMPVVFEAPYGPQRRWRTTKSLKDFKRKMGEPDRAQRILSAGGMYPGERIVTYVGNSDGTRYPVLDVSGRIGYGGHCGLEDLDLIQSLLNQRDERWPSVGTIGHCDWGYHERPGLFNLTIGLWRGSYPQTLAYTIQLAIEGISA